MSRRDATAGDSNVHAVLLAAGRGSRFHDVGHKLTTALPDGDPNARRTVFARSLETVRDAHIGHVTVVTGHLTADELGLGNDPGADVDVAHNPAWADGQMTSVRTGLDRAAAGGAEIVVIGLADQPGIETGAWRAVADAARAGARIAVATYDGRRGNPVGLHRDVWDLLATTGDEGARSLMRLRPDLVVEVPCTGSPNDIDTVEDLTRWQSN